MLSRSKSLIWGMQRNLGRSGQKDLCIKGSIKGKSITYFDFLDVIKIGKGTTGIWISRQLRQDTKKKNGKKIWKPVRMKKKEKKND